MEPTYRAALSHAWKLTWHHKLIWGLGLLSLFLGQFGLSNFLGQLTAQLVTDSGWWPTGWGVLRVASPEQWFWFIWLIFIGIAVLLFVAVAAVCAEGALILTAIHWYHTRTLLSIRTAWRKATQHFWGIFSINILEKLSLSVILAVVFQISRLVSLDTLGGFFTEVLVLAVALFLALIISATFIFALGYTVLDNVPVVEAVGRGWRLLDRHLLVSLELSIVLLLCNFVLVASLSVASFAVLIPSFVLTVLGGLAGVKFLITASVVLYLFLFIMFAAVAGAMFNAFTTSAWMYLFMKMHHEGMASRIGHWASRLLQKKKG